MTWRTVVLVVAMSIVASDIGLAAEPRPLVLRKTVFKTGPAAPVALPPGHAAISDPFPMACNVGRGRCSYEAIVTVQIGENSTSNTSVGLYLERDGGSTCTFSGLIPTDGSHFERTAVLHLSQVARGPHTLRIGVCTSQGSTAKVKRYRATVNLYTH